MYVYTHTHDLVYYRVVHREDQPQELLRHAKPLDSMCHVVVMDPTNLQGIKDRYVYM